MIKVTRKVAAWACSIMIITCIIVLKLAIQTSTTWLIIVSILGIILYAIGIFIVLVDKYG